MDALDNGMLAKEIDALKGEINALKTRLTRMTPWASLQLQIHLTHHCNLDCYACQHFSPLSKEWNITLDSLDGQLKRIAELLPDETRGVHKIWLMGGEPLLHPDVAGAMKVVRRHFTFPKVIFLTNGILLPKQKAGFWEACKEFDITVEITPYPLSLNMDAVVAEARAHGITLEGEGNFLLGDVRTRQFRQGMKPFLHDGTLDPRETWIDCDQANYCVSLQDGKIFQCSSAAYSNIMSEYYGREFLLTERDYVDIYAIRSANELFDYLSRPMPFCRYCNHKKGMHFEWQRTTRHPCEYFDYETQAVEYMEKGDFDAALRLANEVLAHAAFGQAKKWVFRIMAECHERNGELVSAIEAAEKWVAAEPSRALPRENLARLHRNNHELDKAESLALEYIEKHAERRGWAYRELCYINVMRGGGGTWRRLCAWGKKPSPSIPGIRNFRNIFRR